jgi:hypothetical protein
MAEIEYEDEDEWTSTITIEERLPATRNEPDEDEVFSPSDLQNHFRSSIVLVPSSSEFFSKRPANYGVDGLTILHTILPSRRHVLPLPPNGRASI